MFAWFKKLFHTAPKWETLPYRAHYCSGCDRAIQRNERARRCNCKPGGMRHDACMTGISHTCPVCCSKGILIVWK